MTQLFHTPASRRQALIVAAALVFAAAAALAVRGAAFGDELVHFQQVQWFAAGRFVAAPDLTTIPGLHAFVAGVLTLLHAESLAGARCVTMAFALVAAFGFAGIRRALVPEEDPTLATAQFLFFPILFPFCFLLYTDVPSLAMVLWAFRCALGRRHILAGSLCIAALLVRQTNVVWIAFIALLQLLELRTAHRSTRARLRAAVSLWPYGLAVGAFLAYWLWHGTVSLSDAQARAHPDWSVHTGNLFFMLFLVGVFFVPLLPIWLARYAAAARRQPARLAMPLLLAVLYGTTFAVDHPYNTFFAEYVLRNAVLMYVAQHPAAFVALGTVAVVAGCAVSAVRWQRPSFVLLLPVSALFVSASWLIEQRYYLIPVALLLALRVREDRRAERAALAYWMPVAFVLAYAMLDFRYFL